MSETIFYLSREGPGENGMYVYRTAADIVSLNMGYYRHVGLPTSAYQFEWVPPGSNPAEDVQARAYGAGTGRKPFYAPQIIIQPEKPPTLPVKQGNWTVDARVTAQTIDAGYQYLPGDPSQPLFRTLGDNTIGAVSTPGNPIKMTSGNHFFTGFRARLHLDGVQFQGIQSNVKGHVKGRVVKGDECKSLYLCNSDISDTSGIEIKGKSGVSKAQAYLGDRGSDVFHILRNRVKNIDGRVQDGLGGFIRSTTGGTHSAYAWRWHPDVPLAERTAANAQDPTKFSPIGWMPVQFIQMADIVLHPNIRVGYNVIINHPGQSRVEDNISLSFGTGGTQQSPSRIFNNFIQGAWAWDWNHIEGVSTVYDNDNRITLNADGYQFPQETLYSGSCIIADGTVSEAWDYNPHYTQVWDNWCLGHQLYYDRGTGIHHARNRIYELTHYKAGVPFTHNYAPYYGKVRGDELVDLSGVKRLLQSGIIMEDSQIFAGTVEGLMDRPGWVAPENFLGQNLKHPRIAPGGEAAVLAQYFAAQGGVVIGIPADRRAPN